MVSYEVDGPVAVITIRRPDARNAVNEEVAQGIESAIDRLEDDPEVWVGILTGEGSVFSAGTLPVLNVSVGLEVGAGLVLILFEFLEQTLMVRGR